MTGAMQRRLFGRSLLLQAGWSFERMQSLGFAYCVEPWLERCWGGRDGEARLARLRHLEYFNTQPYMAPLVLGMVCALEEDAARAPEADRPAKLARLRQLKLAAAAALAGLGDALFWGALRPFCAVLAVSGAILWRAYPERAALWALGVFLAAYNGPALALRWRFLGLGYDWGDQIAVRLKAWPGQKLIRRLRLAGLAAALAAAALLWRGAPAGLRLPGALALAAAAGLRWAGVSAYRVYAGAVLAGLVAAAAGWL